MLSTILLFTKRELRLTLRDFGHMFMTVITPFLYLVLFSPLLKNINIPMAEGDHNIYNIFIPGMLTLLAFNGGAWVGFGIVDQLRSGLIERFKVAPISSFSILLGLLLHDVFVNLVSIMFFVLVALPFGFRPDWVGLLLSLPLFGLLTAATSSCSYALGLLTKSEDHLAPIIHGLNLPLTLLSGMMLPMSLAPKWLQNIAACTPMYHVIKASRSLVGGDFHHKSIWIAYSVMALLLLLALWAGRKVFKKATY